MKLSRRLIPAFAMLLVSAVLMSTASFAWFSINDEVTAQGMAVNAVADSSLVIMGSKDGTTFSNVGNNEIEATLKPVTSYDGVYFGALNGVDVLSADNAKAEFKYDAQGNFAYSNFGDPITAPAATAEDLSNGYVVTSPYYIKNIGGTVDVYVKEVKVEPATTTAKKLVTAVRVAIQLGDGTVLVFNPNNGANLNDEVGKYTPPASDATQGTWELAEKKAANYASVGTSAVLGELGETQEVVCVYIWIEGQDTFCYSDQVDATDFAVTVKFGATKKTS